MIKPLHIKNSVFPNNLIQGPLAGYSCAPLRLLAKQQGNPAFCYSEMLSAKHLANSNHIAPRFSFKHPEEGPLCIQLSGNNAEELKKASDRAISFGANLLDLNCGCPVLKIRKKGVGSKLLDNPEQLTALIQAMKRDSNIPVSIKLRIDLDTIQKNSLTAALVAEAAGADFITVHGRHWSESYDTPCRQDAIAGIVNAVSIPVIANGDVQHTLSALQLLKNTGAAGIMIARAAVGQPWLFTQIREEAAGHTFQLPTNQEIGAFYLQHVRGLIELEGEKIAILQSRKLLKYYARHLPNQAALLDAVNTLHTYEALRKMISYKL